MTLPPARNPTQPCDPCEHGKYTHQPCEKCDAPEELATYWPDFKPEPKPEPTPKEPTP